MSRAQTFFKLGNICGEKYSELLSKVQSQNVIKRAELLFFNYFRFITIKNQFCRPISNCIGWIGSERDRVELIWPSERFGRLKKSLTKPFFRAKAPAPNVNIRARPFVAGLSFLTAAANHEACPEPRSLSAHPKKERSEIVSSTAQHQKHPPIPLPAEKARQRKRGAARKAGGEGATLVPPAPVENRRGNENARKRTAQKRRMVAPNFNKNLAQLAPTLRPWRRPLLLSATASMLVLAVAALHGPPWRTSWTSSRL